MSNTRIASLIAHVFSIAISIATTTAVAAPVAFASGCADGTGSSPPDAAPPVPIDPTGRFAVTSSYALAATPPVAADVLGELVAATDGPDDPSRFLIDRMIERLPDGSTKTYAAAIAPYVAAYVNQRVASVAPHFVDGSRALSAGMTRVAQRFGTTELIDIGDAGPTVEISGSQGAGSQAGGHVHVTTSRYLARTIVGLRFDLHAGRDVADVRFAPLGLPDIERKTLVTLDGDRLAVVGHTTPLPYTTLLRLGLDFAVIPEVVPGAHDLAQALVTLVDCDQLGAIVSDYVGLGSPTFYAAGCHVALTSLAARIYDRIAAIDAAVLPLELVGAARAVDTDGDGPMDAISAGTWTGDLAGTAATGNFEGSRR
jgi:hypothetical protein